MAKEQVLSIINHLGTANENYKIPPEGLTQQKCHCHVFDEDA